MKKKALILTILSSMTLAAGGLAVALGAGELGFLGGKAGTAAPGEISYSYSSVGHKAISSLKHSFLKTTASGTNIYFYSENNGNLNSKLVATFGGSSYANGFFTFTSDEDGQYGFTFQNITSMTIVTASTSTNGAGFKIFTSKSATTPSYTGTVGVSETKTITEIAGATYIKFAPTSSSWLDIASVTINYSCDPEVEPGEKVLTGIRVKSDYKRQYKVESDFVKPVVYADYVQDEEESTEEVTELAEFTGYNMNSLGHQLVTVSFGGKTTEYMIHVKPTEESISIYYSYLKTDGSKYMLSGEINLYDSVFPDFAEPGDTVNFSIVMREGYSFKAFLPEDEATEIWDQIVDPTSSTQTITMPSSGYSELNISFVLGAPIVAIELAEEPKTEYAVGSNFVAPIVNSVEQNGSKVELDSEDLTFTGFDSSEAVASQTITVSYPNVESIQYTISILSGPQPAESIVGTFEYDRTSNDQYFLIFDSNGSGIYRRYQPSLSKTYEAYFTYSYNSTTGAITMTLTGFNDKTDVTSFYNGYRPFASSTVGAQNTTGLSIGSTDITIQLYRSGNLDSTYTFSK